VEDACDDRPVTDERTREPDVVDDLATRPLPDDDVGLLAGLVSTRAIRRYRDEPVPPEALRTILFAATRAPTGSNRQPFRFLVLTDGPRARQAKALIAGAARRAWGAKRAADGYDAGSGVRTDSPKARMAASMEHYVDAFEGVPVLVLPCLVRYREAGSFEGASIYPACQNLLLAARALGYGGVLSGYHALVEDELRALLDVPDDVFMAATITLGRPVGGHGPVRRRPIGELVYEDRWDQPARWAVDPPGTRHTAAGPPRAPRS
jgi:nitroreductase